MSAPAPVPEQLFRALGIFVVNFAALEESLHDAIWLAAAPGSDMKMINVLTAGLPFRTLVEKFGAACMEAKDLRVSKEEVATFCARLNELNQRRNEYIHSAWQFRDPTQDPTRFKRTARPKAGFSLNVSTAPVAEILKLGDDLLEAERILWGITP
jgi:hypothetical protein